MIEYFFVNLGTGLRKNITEADVVLWERVRRKNIFGVKFRRQQIIE
jgi:very-short-patch-repair endonuclease